MEANSWSDKAMKWWNVKYGKKLKQSSDEAFNAGKKSEAMKRLTLHRIASSLLVPSFAQMVYSAELFTNINNSANIDKK